ncbi:unnamed protein product, partial [Meganyctiphanes norvegica]
MVKDVGCTHIFTEKRRYWGARGKCRSMDGDLAAPNNIADLQSYIQKYRTDNDVSQNSLLDNIWVGIRKNKTSLKWNWESGRKVESSEWLKRGGDGDDEPNGSGNCARLTGSTYYVAEISCQTEYAFMCVITPA